MKKLLNDIKTKHIDTQDKNKVDMHTIKAILSDIDALNGKTDLCIEDVEKLIQKIEGLMADWQKFAEENGERNLLHQELKELLAKIGNDFEILKKKH